MKFWSSYLLHQADGANGATAPAPPAAPAAPPTNPFSKGGDFSESSVAERFPSAERKRHKEKPSPGDVPPKRPEAETAPPPAEEHEPEPAPDDESAPPEPEAAAAPETEAAPQAKPDEYPTEVQELLDRFGDVGGLAKGYKEIRALQGKTAEKVNKLLEFFEEGPDGEPMLRVDRASERLRAQRGGDPIDYDGLTAEPKLEYVEQYIEKQWRDHYAKTGHDAEGIDELIEQHRPLLKQYAKSEQSRIKAAQHEAVQKIERRAGQILYDHLQRHPKDRDLIPRLDKVFAGMPEHRRYQFAIEGQLGGIPQIMRWLRMEASYNDAVKAAFESGKKVGAATPQPTKGGSPGATGRAPGKPRGHDGDEEVAAWKANLVNPSRQSTIERLGLK